MGHLSTALDNFRNFLLVFLMLPRGGYLVGRQLLAGNGLQPAEGTAGVGEADVGVDQGGVGCPDLGPDILCGVSVGPVVWVRYVGD